MIDDDGWADVFAFPVPDAARRRPPAAAPPDQWAVWTQSAWAFITMPPVLAGIGIGLTIAAVVQTLVLVARHV